MASTITSVAIGPTSPNETRLLLYITIEYNSNTYNWAIFGPPQPEVDINNYLTIAQPKIELEIDTKEAEWAALDPKTKVIQNEAGDDITVDIPKEEIVRPTIPDYYAMRRAEYPTLTDQLGAVFKGPTSPDFLDMLVKIEAVKAKYPKPPWV